MDRKKLIYHKNNIEKAQTEIEQWMAHKKDLDHEDLYMYATMKGVINAVGWLLDEAERSKNGK